jgi:hypothetical protein
MELNHDGRAPLLAHPPRLPCLAGVRQNDWISQHVLAVAQLPVRLVCVPSAGRQLRRDVWDRLGQADVQVSFPQPLFLLPTLARPESAHVHCTHLLATLSI